MKMLSDNVWRIINQYIDEMEALEHLLETMKNKWCPLISGLEFETLDDVVIFETICEWELHNIYKICFQGRFSPCRGLGMWVFVPAITEPNQKLTFGRLFNFLKDSELLEPDEHVDGFVISEDCIQVFINRNEFRGTFPAIETQRSASDH